MGKLEDKGTCMYPKRTLCLKILGVKLVCGPIIPSDSQYQHLPYMLCLICIPQSGECSLGLWSHWLV